MRISFRLTAGLAFLLSACAAVDAPSTLTGDYLGARFAAKFNDVDAAARAYEGASAAADFEDASLRREAFFYDLAAGRIDRALGYANAESLKPDDGVDGLSRLLLAADAVKSGDYLQAEVWLRTNFKDPFVRSIAHLAKSWAEAGVNGPLAGAATLASGDPNHFRGFDPLHLAVFNEMNGDIDAARASYAEAVQGYGGPVAREAFGAFLERHGPEAAARDYYTQMAGETGPPRWIATSGLARLDRGASSMYLANTTPTEGLAVAFYSFGGAMLEQAAIERGRAAAAGFRVGDPRFNLPLALGNIALWLDPTLVEARRLVGSIYLAYDSPVAAISVLEAVPPSSPHYEQARIEMAAAYASDAQAETGIAILEKAIRAAPDSIEARLTLASILSDQKRFDEAVDVASAAIGRLGDAPNSDAWRYFIVRGGALVELKRWAEAETDLERAVELAPDEPTTLNYLGYSWVERGLNIDEAFEMIEKALSLNPNSGAITDSLGWAHYQRGDYEEARTHLERAASLEPADPTITDHLGDVYWRLGRKLEAQFQWTRALELEPAPDVAEKIRVKIKDGLARND